MTCIICIPNNREDIIMAMQSATALATHLGFLTVSRIIEQT